MHGKIKTKMGFRVLTYAISAVICFFLSSGKEAATEQHPESAIPKSAITESLPTEAAAETAYLTPDSASFTQQKAACNPPRQTNCSSSVRYSQNAKRTHVQKSGNSYFVKSDKIHNNITISPFLNTARCFPSGSDEPAQKFISLHKLVI